MIINNKLYADLFIESHKQLAIKSLQTLNNLNNFIIVNYGNNIGYEIIPIREFNFLDSNNVATTILNEYNAGFFVSYNWATDIALPGKKAVFIVINNQIGLCRNFEVKDVIRYFDEDKDYLELLVNHILF